MTDVLLYTIAFMFALLIIVIAVIAIGMLLSPLLSNLYDVYSDRVDEWFYEREIEREKSRKNKNE